MNNLIHKYIPKISSDILGTTNQKHIQYIKNWLKTFQKSKDNNITSIVICGPHGVGKTSAVKLLLQESEYNIKYLSSSNLKQYKTIKDIIPTSNINLLFNDFNKTAIVIDDSETITLTSEKNTLLQLFKDNEISKKHPIIFITNEQHSKLISDIKKSCVEQSIFHFQLLVLH